MMRERGLSKLAQYNLIYMAQYMSIGAVEGLAASASFRQFGRNMFLVDDSSARGTQLDSPHRSIGFTHQHAGPCDRYEATLIILFQYTDTFR